MLCNTTKRINSRIGCLRRNFPGWNLIFYGTVITTAASALELAPGYRSSAVGTVIGLWLLFDVRGLYK